MNVIFWCLIAISIFSGVRSGSFTTSVTMEKLYTLEDELITIADLVLRHEKLLHEDEDIHSVYKIASTVENVKDIHREVPAENMTSYLAHPINAFHLTKRLVRNWTDVLTVLSDSRTCAKFMRVKIDNIKDNIPGEDEVTRVSQAIIHLQSMYNIPLEQLMEGRIENETSLSALSLDDAFDFARAAYANNDFYHSVAWLQYVMSRYGQEVVSYSKTNALSLLASSFFMLKRHKAALDTLDTLLEIDPENVLAKRNRQFMKERTPEGAADTPEPPLTKPEPKKKRQKLIEKICTGTSDEKKNNTWMRCMLLKPRGSSLFSRPSIQIEILKYKPFIILIHNITNTTVQKYVYQLGYEKMRDWLYKDRYRYPQGMETMEVQDLSQNQSIPILEEKLLSIPLTSWEPQETRFTVHNIGMEGYCWHGNVKPKKYRYRLGTFFAFLSDTTFGGELVFPLAGVKVTPQKGSVLFWDQKALSQACICPVRLGAQWVGIYPLYEDYQPHVSSAHALWKPNRSMM